MTALVSSRYITPENQAQALPGRQRAPMPPPQIRIQARLPSIQPIPIGRDRLQNNRIAMPPDAQLRRVEAEFLGDADSL